jgi:hypothetical protein
MTQPATMRCGVPTAATATCARASVTAQCGANVLRNDDAANAGAAARSARAMTTQSSTVGCNRACNRQAAACMYVRACFACVRVGCDVKRREWALAAPACTRSTRRNVDAQRGYAASAGCAQLCARACGCTGDDNAVNHTDTTARYVMTQRK